MLYLESPAGVGFSYSSNSSDYEGVNDRMTGAYFFNCIEFIGIGWFL
jgi:Serine carboxypeptidase